MNQLVRQNDEFIDALEGAMAEIDNPIKCPLKHFFTKGLYVRAIFMPKYKHGVHLLTSKIHKTQHQFFVLQGDLSVSIDGQEAHRIQAPYFGKTEAGTRRILAIHEDTIFATAHPLDFITGEENDWSEEEKEKLLEKIEDVLLEKHENKYLNKKELA